VETLSEHHVGGFEVAMDHAAVVCRFESFGNFVGES
jgi:hypothetical protein